MAALRKSQTETITVPASTHARLQEIAREQARPMGEIVTDLVERYEDGRIGDEPTGPNAHLRRRAEETRLHAARMREEGVDPLAEIEKLAAELFPDEESRLVLLHFIERGTIDDID